MDTMEVLPGTRSETVTTDDGEVVKIGVSIRLRE